MDELERLLDEAEQALDRGEHKLALALAQEAEALDPASADAVFLQAEALLDAGDVRAAEPLYGRADEMAPDEPFVLSGRGICLFELGRFDVAEQLLRLALSLDSRLAEAHHHLGLLLERHDQLGEAEKCFAQARELTDGGYAEPIEMSEAEFDACIETALEALPKRVQAALENVDVSVEPLPAEQDLSAADPPLSPQILGLWRGTPVNERTVFDPWTQLPAGIVLYQNNLQRIAGDRQELIDQIRITVLHEVGHALGLSEAELDDRGLS